MHMGNILKGQFVRMRRNCNNLEDHFAQADVLKTRFLEKGYDEITLNTTIQQVLVSIGKGF